ncbi:substrate-binding domain-containing protein [Cellulomonas sp. URHD0024]|uniref:substrate-binding domain-containing protein n=1 Tax=Cellulomonas sp. URHD0024 TaxID=1302620 RepID=UPI000488F635|nr:substrate-binding domain-containing protein [Cellulomonas sp. URHD0024]
MSSRTSPSRRRSARSLVALGAVAILLAACSSTASQDAEASASAAVKDRRVAVSLIVKTTSNPFFIAMQKGAEAAAQENDVDLTFAAGREDGDETVQIQAIEDAISRGQNGILITPNGPGVLEALDRAREAGLYVIALDTAPDPADAVDITFATDNFDAGKRIGAWTASQLGGKKAVIAMLNLFDDKVVSVDYNRGQGFLTGMGIDTADPKINGDEAESGTYSGGEYTIVCNEAAQGAEDGGTTAMETCLSKNPDINVVYTLNEPTAYGAFQALTAAGKTSDDVLMTSVDGGCAGVGYVKDGIIDATSQQYPVRMAQEGVAAIATLNRFGAAPKLSPGLDFFDTGDELVTDTPAAGIESIDTTEASKICWG